MRLDYLPLISVALMLIVSAAAYNFLPQTMTVHWNLLLKPDGYAPKTFAVLILPAIGLVLIAMQLIGRMITNEGGTTIQFSHAALIGLPVLLIAHIGVILVGLMSAGRG